MHPTVMAALFLDFAAVGMPDTDHVLPLVVRSAASTNEMKSLFRMLVAALVFTVLIHCFGRLILVLTVSSTYNAILLFLNGGGGGGVCGDIRITSQLTLFLCS
jgi:hypothetical protein